MINYPLERIKALVFDVDGVLSASTVPMDENGQPRRTANMKDGYALQLAAKSGLHVAILTGGKGEEVRRRYEYLGVQHIFLGCTVKLRQFESYLEELELSPDEVLYMGDDIPDLEVLQACGCACCPVDACSEVKAASLYVSPFAGGYGCGRDVIEQVLRAQGLWVLNAPAFG